MPYFQIAKKVEIPASSAVTVEIESGVPYYNMVIYLNGNAINLSVQPMFGGANDGVATAVAAPIHTKIYQMSQDLVRPATTGIAGVTPLKSAVKFTNSDVSDAVIDLLVVALTP